MKDEIKKALISSHSLKETSGKILGIKTNNKRKHIKDFEDGMKGKLAIYYHRFWRKQKGRTLRIVNKFNKINVFSKSPDTIIDLGCGPGAFLIELAKKSEKPVGYVGIDKSPDMIKIAKKQLAKSRLSKKIKRSFKFLVKDIGDYRTYKLIKNLRPKYITSIQLFHQTKNPKAIIKKIIGALPKDARIFFDDLDRESVWKEKRKRLLYLLETFPDPCHGIRTHLGALSKKEIIEICKNLSLRRYKVCSNKWSKNEDSHWTVSAIK